MTLSVDPRRRVRNYDTLEEDDTVEVVYRRSWTSDERRCTGTVVETMGPAHDRSYVVEPDDGALAGITLHARNGSTGTVDGESAHEMAVAMVE